MLKCLHCGEETLLWQSDSSNEDYGIEGEGIVSTYYCENCGATIECYVTLNDEQ